MNTRFCFLFRNDKILVQQVSNAISRKITVNDQSVEVSNDTRLTTAIEQLGINIGHRCGGKARCTTCRVEVLSGDSDMYTEAEYEKLKQRDLLGSYRLSCQLVCGQDMEVNAIMTLESQGWTDTGPELDDNVVPAAEWFSADQLASDE